MAGSDIGRHVTHKDPKTVGCEWCGGPSVKAIRIEGKATFTYACDSHVAVAERTAKKPPRRINV